MAIEQSKIDELRAEHGEIVVIGANGFDIVLAKTEIRAKYKRFKTMVMDEKKRVNAAEQLARDLLVYPSLAAFEEILDGFPAMAEILGAEATKFCGMTEEIEVKKF